MQIQVTTKKVLECFLGPLPSSPSWAFLYSVKGSTACLLYFDSSPTGHWTHTHTSTHSYKSTQREIDSFVFFFFPFIAVWQGDLIPNVLYQAGPILSIIKRMNIDFLQENHDISSRDVWFHHLVQKFHSARILLYMLCCSSFNYPSRIFQQSNLYFSG